MVSSVLPSFNFALFQELSRSAVVSSTIAQLCIISGVVKVGSGQLYHHSTLPYFRSCQGRQWSVLPSLNFALFQELSRSAVVSSTIAQLCLISGVVKVGSGQLYHHSTLPYFRSCQGRQWSVLPSLNFALFQELSRSAVVSSTITQLCPISGVVKVGSGQFSSTIPQLCLSSGVVKVGSGQFYHHSTLPYFRSCQGRQWSGQFYHPSTFPYFRSCQGRQWSVKFYHPSTLPYFRSCQDRQWSVKFYHPSTLP